MLKILLSHETFKGKQGNNLLTIEMGVTVIIIPPLPAGLSTSCDIPLDIILLTQVGHTLCSGDH